MEANNDTIQREGYFANLLRMQKFNQDDIYTKALVKFDSFSSTLICLTGGSAIAKHTSSANACIQVINGTGVCRLGAQDISLEAGVFVFIPPHVEHSLAADTDLSFLLCLAH